MKEHFFFVDAETDGLYGKFLSIAALVTYCQGQNLSSFYGSIKIDPSDIKTEWVKENVFPYLENADLFFDDETELLEAFWNFWLLHRESSECVAYVPYPVESRLFSTCVMNNVEKRQFLAPFPLYDLATLLESKKIDFNSNMQQLSSLNLQPHDAMDDVRMTAAVWLKLFRQ